MELINECRVRNKVAKEESYEVSKSMNSINARNITNRVLGVPLENA